MLLKKWMNFGDLKMNNTNRKYCQYLGDGIYAEWVDSGIWLRSGDHRDEYCNNKIYLEKEILIKLNIFNSNIEILSKNE